MQNPKVSIIVAAYNVEEFISACIESCLKQVFSELEVIIVNDGSTDRTTEILLNFELEDSRVKVVKKANEGLNFARRDGIRNARGDYIFFLDGDDTIPKDAISTLLNVAKQFNSDIVVGSIQIQYLNGAKSVRSYDKFISGNGVAFLEYILENKMHYLCGKLIRRSLYIDNKIVHKKEIVIGEDQIQLYQLCMFANKVNAVNESVYYYLINESSITQKFERVVYSRNQFNYSKSINELIRLFNYNSFINQQLYLRILIAFHQTVGRVGKEYDQYDNMKRIASVAINKFLLGNKSVICSNFYHIIKAKICCVSPNIYFMLRKKYQNSKSHG